MTSALQETKEKDLQHQLNRWASEQGIDLTDDCWVSRTACQKFNSYFRAQSDRLNRWSKHRFNRCLRKKVDNGYKWLVRLGSLYICLHTAIWKLLEFRDTPYTLENTSKPSKCLLIKSLVLSTPLWVLVLKLALETVWDQGVVPCVLVPNWTELYLGVLAILRVLVARQQVYDPPTWCEAAWTAFCGGRGGPILRGEAP